MTREPNPVLRRLGFDPTDRVAIVHADDLGMAQGSVPAFEELVAFGLVSSGAVMVPCPWFPAVADFCRRHPGADVGVHLTLTSEWDSYRWGPISTREATSGLLDDEGYFPRTAEQVQAQARVEAVTAEMEAQVARALAAGIDVTHVDTHMGTVAAPQFIPAYIQLATAHGLPPMVPRYDEEQWIEFGFDAGTAAFAAQFVQALEALGVPLLDHLTGLHLDDDVDRLELAMATFDALPAGLTHLIIHPAKDTPELRAATPRTWRARVADYRVFSSEALRAHVRQLGVHIIGYREIRDRG
ncbi:MAG: polysaccharide deacetylase family protein [Anaerolineae bacterium]|nr:polysaccharide deacetylase family protein [Anaerolineae bacterium]